LRAATAKYGRDLACRQPRWPSSYSAEQFHPGMAKSFPQCGCNYGTALLRTENAMKMGADVGHTVIQPSLRDLCNPKLLVPTLKRWAIITCPSGTGDLAARIFISSSQIKRLPGFVTVIYMGHAAFEPLSSAGLSDRDQRSCLRARFQCRDSFAQLWFDKRA